MRALDLSKVVNPKVKHAEYTLLSGLGIVTCNYTTKIKYYAKHTHNSRCFIYEHSERMDSLSEITFLQPRGIWGHPLGAYHPLDW